MLSNTNDYKKYIYYFLRSVLFIINVILNIFCLFLFLLSISRIYWGPKKNLDIFKIDYYQVISESMEPEIKKWNIVVVKQIPDKEKQNIVKGDIVIFKNDKYNKNIIHRVVSNDINSAQIQTKGDKNKDKDDFLTEYNYILAKHIFTISCLEIFLFFFFFIFLIFSNDISVWLKNLFLSSNKKNNLYK